LALSGGVDSSVAALILKNQGYDITGVFMKCWDEKADGCKSDEDRASAVEVAGTLGIKFTALDFVKDYKKRVISYFYDEYRKGYTPNPDIVCNTDIKFGLYLDWALKEGFDYIATGHYARVQKNGLVKLLRGKDESKDQSYFLYRLKQDQLSKAVFPLGDLNKSEVRKLAREAGLSTYDRPDSQGICFVGKVDIKNFLQKEIKPQKGKVFHVNGEEIGTHDGAWYYTIGQRHGFEINKYFGLPLYVVDKDVKKNELTVGFIKDVMKSQFTAGELHWISGILPENLAKGKMKCLTRIRHLGELYPSEILLEEDKVKVKMNDKALGIAPGQSAVFYDGEEVLGGGIIE
jgi:tRNA-specific 2-thiouridylase